MLIDLINWLDWEAIACLIGIFLGYKTYKRFTASD